MTIDEVKGVLKEIAAAQEIYVNAMNELADKAAAELKTDSEILLGVVEASVAAVEIYHSIETLKKQLG